MRALALVLAGGHALLHGNRAARVPRRLVVRGKKSKRPNREDAWAARRAAEAAAAARQDGRATALAPATIAVGAASVAEDHRHEQFFYDEPSAARLLRRVALFERPLLVCNPSLAARLDAGGADNYLLLDRDERFDALRFRRFDLAAPEPVDDFDFDAIFLDPPFANVAPHQLAAACRVLLGDRDPRATPLFVGYNVKRAAALEEAFADWDITETGEALSYATGVMRDQIMLFTNHKPWGVRLATKAAAAPRAARLPAATPPKTRAPAETPPARGLGAWIAAENLGPYERDLRALANDVDDLREMTDADFDALVAARAVPVLAARRLKRALRAAGADLRAE